jgi:hypothetical protein
MDEVVDLQEEVTRAWATTVMAGALATRAERVAQE